MNIKIIENKLIIKFYAYSRVRRTYRMFTFEISTSQLNYYDVRCLSRLVWMTVDCRAVVSL